MTGTEKLPTSTATPVRLRLFQATRRPQQTTLKAETSFGTLTVTGRLGQAHADLLECAMFFAERHRVNDGRLEIVIDQHRIRKAMAGGAGKYSASQVKTLARDLRQAELETDTPTVNIKGRIVEKVVESKITKADRRAWVTDGERHLECWVFSQEWTAFVQNDIGRFYDPTPLCRIEHGSVAAIARHVLTHQHQPNGGWKLEGLMQAAGVTRQASKVRQEIVENADALSEMGIRMDGDRVFLAAPAPSVAAPAPFLPDFSHTRPIF